MVGSRSPPTSKQTVLLWPCYPPTQGLHHPAELQEQAPARQEGLQEGGQGGLQQVGVVAMVVKVVVKQQVVQVGVVEDMEVGIMWNWWS